MNRIMENKLLKSAKKAVADAYHDYPFIIDLVKYDEIMSKLIMKITLKTMSTERWRTIM